MWLSMRSLLLLVFVFVEWIANVRLCVAVSEFASLTTIASNHLVCSVRDTTRTHTTTGSSNQEEGRPPLLECLTLLPIDSVRNLLTRSPCIYTRLEDYPVSWPPNFWGQTHIIMSVITETNTGQWL
ncbi:hypothetical protein DER46DRAFT_618656 [Fusarium sp. MPI-SDFR-AT-0072]|nr:hypothetical protein DER46DRAFT_618656 [Fusarium sp. MPI-SDFR-AT-0072]